MLEKKYRLNNCLIFFAIFSLALGSCQNQVIPAIPATEEVVTEPPLSSSSSPSSISNTNSFAPDTIQVLMDSGLVSQSTGNVIWEKDLLEFYEPEFGILSWYPIELASSNFIIYTEFTWDSEETAETACGVYFRDNNQGNSYTSLVRKNGDAFLWLSVNNNWQPSPAESYQNPVNSGNRDTNTLMVVAENENISLVINNTIAYQVTDFSLSEGDMGFVNGTAQAGNTCTFSNSWVWEIQKSPSSQAAEPPSAEEPIHDIYAGFTGDSEIPFLALHKDGEALGVTKEEGIVWTSPSQDSMVVFQNDKGLPKSAVVGDVVIRYGNYTSTTVDVTVFLPDGSHQVIRTQYSSDLKRLMAARYAPSDYSVMYVSPDSKLAQDQDVLNTLDNALFNMGVAQCVLDSIAASNLKLEKFLKKVAKSCTGPLISLRAKEGQAENMDVRYLQAAGVLYNTYGCFKYKFEDCVSVIVDSMQILRVKAVGEENEVAIPPADSSNPPKDNSKDNVYP